MHGTWHMPSGTFYVAHGARHKQTAQLANQPTSQPPSQSLNRSTSRSINKYEKCSVLGKEELCLGGQRSTNDPVHTCCACVLIAFGFAWPNPLTHGRCDVHLCFVACDRNRALISCCAVAWAPFGKEYCCFAQRTPEGVWC